MALLKGLSGLYVMFAAVVGHMDWSLYCPSTGVSESTYEYIRLMQSNVVVKLTSNFFSITLTSACKNYIFHPCFMKQFFAQNEGLYYVRFERKGPALPSISASR